jgi:hypothetical protein
MAPVHNSCTHGPALPVACVHLHEIPFQIKGRVELNMPAVAAASGHGRAVQSVLGFALRCS